MARKRKPKVDQFAKLKIAAIPVLLAVLGFVLWSNFSGESGGAGTKRVAKNPPKVKTTSSAAEVRKETVAKVKREIVAVWPEPSLEFLNSESPFQKMDYEPPKLPSERLVSKPKVSESTRAKEALASAAKTLRNARIEYTFQSSNQSAFLFDDRLIKVGDEFTKDIIVRSISPNGIELAVRDSDVSELSPSVN